MRVYSEKAMIRLFYFFLMDDLEMFEVLYRLHHSVYEVNVSLTSSYRHLQERDCHQGYEEVKVQGEDGVSKD